MITITANLMFTFFRCHRLAFSLFIVLGLSGCTPIAMPTLPSLSSITALPQFPAPVPQADPLPSNVFAQAQQRPQPVAPKIAQARPIVQAPAAKQNYAAVQRPQPAAPASRVQRQGIKPVAQVSLPPVLKPIQTARAPLVNPEPAQQRYAQPARPSASVSRAPTYYQDQTAVRNNTVRTTPTNPSTNSVRRPTAAVAARKGKTANKVRPQKTAPAKRAVKKAPVPKPAIRPAQRPTASTSQASTAAAEPKVQEKEVLDLSAYSQKPAATVKPEKKAATAPVRNYNSPAVAVLMKQASNDLSAGKRGRAAATLERALRIAPDNPMLWLRLGEVNAQQGNKTQAKSMARKAMNLAPNDTSVQARAQRLLN